jgi:hypothetical protein
VKVPIDDWLMDMRRRSLGARRQLARLVAWRHGSAPTAAASGVEHGAER